MNRFEILFDDAEPSPVEDPAYAPYGKLGFPPAPAERPWTYANFVQSLDGIASFRGKHPSGSDISQSAEDRWLMDLLRAHAGGIITGMSTLVEEARSLPHLNKGRGPVYRIVDPAVRELRARLGLGRERNIFVTGSGGLDLSAYRVFDGEVVDAIIVTTSQGAANLAKWKSTHPQVKVIVAGEGSLVDLELAVRILRKEFGIERLLCEGGPMLYGHMLRAGLIDEQFLTVSPLEIGLLVPREQEPAEWEKLHPPQERPTIFMAPGFTKENAPWWRWMSCRRVGNHQFSRYRRKA